MILVGKMANNFLQPAINNILEAEFFLYSVIGDPILGEIISTDFF